MPDHYMDHWISTDYGYYNAKMKDFLLHEDTVCIIKKMTKQSNTTKDYLSLAKKLNKFWWEWARHRSNDCKCCKGHYGKRGDE